MVYPVYAQIDTSEVLPKIKWTRKKQTYIAICLLRLHHFPTHSVIWMKAPYGHLLGKSHTMLLGRN